jgi:uncharacterized membrane protein YoaK (UPF0700 family)
MERPSDRQVPPGLCEASKGVILAAVGGYLDTLGFMMLGGLFVNHVTGNIILAAAEPGRESLPEIVMFPVFFVMVVVGTALAGKAERRSPSLGIPVALMAEAVFLGIFLVLGLVLVPRPGAAGLLAEVVVGAAGVSAMAIQTAVTRLAGYLFPTNMVTGTMTVLGMDTAGLLFRFHGSGEERAVISRRAREYARVVAGFASGAVVAAVVTSFVEFWAAALPLLVIVLGARRELASARERNAIEPPRHSIAQ